VRRSLLVLLLALAAAASVARPAPASASCAPVIVWHDVAYFGYPPSVVRTAPLPGRRVGGAVAPACNDTGGGAGSPTSVGARRVAGVPPRVVLLSGGEIYIPSGELPQLPGFPVAFTPDPPLTCRVTAHVTVSGHAVPEAGALALGDVRAGRHLQLTDGRLDIVITARTQVTGLTRHGVVDIGYDQALVIHAFRCGHQIVATRIAPAGPIARPMTAEDALGADWRGGASFFRDRTTYAAAAIVAVGALVVLGLRAGRRPPAAHRG
jgi:hypothetical protein